MIDIKFLDRHHVTGLEFLDFQSGGFFNELVSAFDEVINNNALHEIPDRLSGIIYKYSGFKNVEFELIDYANLAIDAGFINPGNVFNIDSIEDYFPRSESTLYKWYRSNKNTFLKGGVDYANGKVTGDYSELPFNVFINRNLTSYINKAFLEKYKVSYSEALSAMLIHEIGHAFGGVSMIHTLAEDNIIARAAVGFFSKAKNTEQKVTVVKNAADLIDPDNKLNKKTIEAIADGDQVGELVVCLNKVAGTRTTRRSLSLGVPKMSSEVIADAYSARMGCPKSLAVGLGAVYRQGDIQIRLFSSVVSVLMGVYLAGATGALGLLFVPSIAFGFLYLLYYFGNATPDTYNSEYRRILNILQEVIANIKQNTTASPGEKKRALANAETIMKVLQERKPWIEDTGFQSFFNWLTNGSDAKYINIEHYTQSLANHKVNLLTSKLSNL